MKKRSFLVAGALGVTAAMLCLMIGRRIVRPIHHLHQLLDVNLRRRFREPGLAFLVFFFVNDEIVL